MDALLGGADEFDEIAIADFAAAFHEGGIVGVGDVANSVDARVVHRLVGGETVVIIKNLRMLQSDNPVQKFRETFARRNEAFEVREFEVAVRVDEARHEDAVIIRCVGGLGGQLADFHYLARGLVVCDDAILDGGICVCEYVLRGNGFGHGWD